MSETKAQAKRLYEQASALAAGMARRLEAAIEDRDLDKCERLHGVFVGAQRRTARRLNRWGTLVIWGCP